MGTAVLHPQDYLQSDRNHGFSRVSECPSSVARPCRRAISATYEAPPIPTTGDVALGSRILNQGRGLLGRKNASAGLLPLPDQTLRSAHSSFRRLAPKISPCRSGEIVNPCVSKLLTSSHHSNFSLYASDMPISRCPSVPMLDNAARSQRFFSGCFPLHGVQIHERRPSQRDSRLILNSAHGGCMVGSSSCAAGAVVSCQKLKFLANSQFSDVFNPVCSKWANCTDQSFHYRKRMHPELSQGEVYLGRQYAKPPFKVLPDRQGESICTNTICTNTSTVDRKHGVNKQLKRSASEKRQERMQVPILQRTGTKEAAKKQTSNLFEGVLGLHTAKCRSSKIEVKITPSAPATSSLEGKTAKGLQTQASLDADTQGSMCIFKTGAERSSQVTVSQQMGGTERNVGASFQGQCYGSADAAMEHKEVLERDQITGLAGYVFQDRYALRKVDVRSTINNQLAVSNIRKPDTVMGSENMSRSLNSALSNDEMWVSMTNDERWAGPSFFNSPSPSSLPLPSFTFKFSRTASTGSVPSKTVDYGAHIVSENSLLKAKCTWDVVFATKDLRRMLNLDHASCDF